MHLKLFSKLQKPYKLSLLGKYILKKPIKPKKPQKNKKTNKKKHWTGFFKKHGFFPTLPQRHLGELGEELGDGEPVLLAQVVEQAQRVVLHHHVVRT
jgi:hypothetical protein